MQRLAIVPALRLPPARRLLPALPLLALCACGCMSTRVTRVARFEPNRPPAAVREAAPRSAAYKVKYAVASGSAVRTAGGTKRIVRRGDTLGFASSRDGTLVAVAGDEQIPLDGLPPTVRYCVWTAREERPTQFSREVGKAAVTAVVVPAAGALLIGSAYLDAQNDECEQEEESKLRERRHRYEEEKRIDRWMKANELKPQGWRPTPAPY